MHVVHLAALDLNLLVALDALLVEGSVTRAARRTGITQPAMSHALARLRHVFDDPLFVRTPRGMEPTPRALAVAPGVARALAEIEHAIATPAFDPATARRTFAIATSDYSELVLLPALLARLEATAPHVDLVFRPVPPGLDELARGAVDVVVRPLPVDHGAGHHVETLFHERFVCLMRRGHRLARRRLTLDGYVAADHLLVSPHGSRTGVVDTLLERLGRTRRVALVLQHFLVAPHVVASTDLVMTVGERVARAFARMLPLVVREPPLEVPPLAVAQIWHERQAVGSSRVDLQACKLEYSIVSPK